MKYPHRYMNWSRRRKSLAAAAGAHNKIVIVIRVYSYIIHFVLLSSFFFCLAAFVDIIIFFGLLLFFLLHMRACVSWWGFQFSNRCLIFDEKQKENLQTLKSYLHVVWKFRNYVDEMECTEPPPDRHRFKQHHITELW